MPQDKKLKTQPENATDAVENKLDEGSVETGQRENGPVNSADNPGHVAQNAAAPETDLPDKRAEEYGGQPGLEPTRYGDWEKKGRCTDF